MQQIVAIPKFTVQLAETVLVIGPGTIEIFDVLRLISGTALLNDQPSGIVVVTVTQLLVQGVCENVCLCRMVIRRVYDFVVAADRGQLVLRA